MIRLRGYVVQSQDDQLGSMRLAISSRRYDALLWANCILGVGETRSQLTIPPIRITSKLNLVAEKANEASLCRVLSHVSCFWLLTRGLQP